ncbi:MAG TPA: hypothetical protein VIJ89_07115 [Deferrimonas sp.]
MKKRWILVQTRTDMICRQQELLEAWRPLAKDFDIFIGLEAATDAGLSRVDKDVPVSESVEAVRIARSLRYGVNGNFLVDPDWGEEDFLRLWEFVACHGLQRAGYTILTPLPGTDYFRKLAPLLAGQPWPTTTCTTSSGSLASGRDGFSSSTLAQVDPQYVGRETVGRLDAADPAGPATVPCARPMAHPEDDESRGLPPRAREDESCHDARPVPLGRRCIRLTKIRSTIIRHPARSPTHRKAVRKRRT